MIIHESQSIKDKKEKLVTIHKLHHQFSQVYNDNLYYHDKYVEKIYKIMEKKHKFDYQIDQTSSIISESLLQKNHQVHLEKQETDPHLEESAYE